MSWPKHDRPYLSMKEVEAILGRNRWAIASIAEVDGLFPPWVQWGRSKVMSRAALAKWMLMRELLASIHRPRTKST